MRGAMTIPQLSAGKDLLTLTLIMDIPLQLWGT